MKIIILYTYNQGYLSSFFLSISRQLVKDGHDVYNLSLKSSDRHILQDNVNLIIMKKGGYIKNYLSIYKVFRKIKPDIILSNFSYVNPSLVIGKLLGVKSNLIWFHSLNDQIHATKRNIFIKRQFLKLADTVIANSLHTQKELTSLYRVPTKKIEKVPFWTDIHEKNIKFQSIDEAEPFIKIGCPGRLEAHKNQRVILDACKLLKDKGYTNFTIYLAGTGADMQNLRRQADKLNLIDNIVFLGKLSATEMVVFYKSMDVIVLPSLHEAFGLVFIEPLALGVPVIVSKSFGALTFIDESLDTIEKISFDPIDKYDLAKKLTYYLEKDGLSEKVFMDLYKLYFDHSKTYKKIKSVMLKSNETSY